MKTIASAVLLALAGCSGTELKKDHNDRTVYTGRYGTFYVGNLIAAGAEIAMTVGLGAQHMGDAARSPDGDAVRSPYVEPNGKEWRP